MWGCGPDLSGSGLRKVTGSCEHDSEPSLFIKMGIYRLGEELLASQKDFFSMKFISLYSLFQFDICICNLMPFLISVGS